MNFEIPLDVPDGHSRQFILSQHGPELDVVVTTLPCWEGSTPTKVSIHGKALLDTGSGTTLVRLDSLKTLGIRKKNGESRDTASGEAMLPKYDGVCIAFPGTGLRLFPLTEVLGSPMTRTPHLAVVVGRDILQFLVMKYDGAAGRVTIDSPDAAAKATLTRVS